MTEHRPTLKETIALLQSLGSKGTAFSFDETKQTIRYRDEDTTICELTLPLVLPTIKSGSLNALLGQIAGSSQSYSIVLIQAGSAAIGLYENAELTLHRVIKKYMVRKKQGKSQIKHLKSKGKSRLGSRIRLQNSIVFFEDINKTLTEWDIASKSETILLSLPINLKHLLFTAKVPSPFDKKDPRIKKIPVDVKVPSFQELLHINWIVRRGALQKQQDSGDPKQ